MTSSCDNYIYLPAYDWLCLPMSYLSLLMSTKLPVSTYVYIIIPTYIYIGIIFVLLNDASCRYGAIGMRPALISCVGSVIEYLLSRAVSENLNPVTLLASAVWLSARSRHACNGF